MSVCCDWQNFNMNGSFEAAGTGRAAQHTLWSQDRRGGGGGGGPNGLRLVRIWEKIRGGLGRLVEVRRNNAELKLINSEDLILI